MRPLLRRFAAALALLYLLLLAASHLVRLLDPWEPSVHAWERVVELAEVRGAEVGSRPISVAVFDSAPAGRADLPAVVLLHGSPGSNDEVAEIARHLAHRFRVLAPDLPGFGGSDRGVPDYSFLAHAGYVRQLLDSLKIRRAHLVGFSMGGGVILSLADLAPERVASLTLLSAIGVQELELLGDYHLNRGIHWLQLAGLRLLHQGVPHFGAWDGAFLSVEYARNFYDSDQRPLRRILGAWTGPLLIIQGTRDVLVPPAVGPEHHRLVPQSELWMPDGDHFMAFLRAPEIAARLGDFIGRAEAGTAPVRASAPPERIRAAELPFDPKTIPPAAGLALVVLLLLLAAATFVSEDLTCIAAGLLVARGTVAFLPAAAACGTGIVLGDFGLYWAGRLIGRPAVRRRPFRWFVSDGDLRRTSAWFARRGPALVLTTRFLPGTRLPTYLAAGILHTRFPSFAGYFLLAAALWTPALVGLAVLYGDQVLTGVRSWERWSLPLLFAAGVALLIVVELLIPLCSWRGRRLLLSKWRRLTRWEFWPPWAFYPPVVLYILWLGVRHRDLTLFTAANPAMPGGGFVGESKGEILRALRGPPRKPGGPEEADHGVARTVQIHAGTPADARASEVAAFMASEGLTYPLVLKPDIGERGGGVRIVRTPEEARAYLERATEDILAQEYIPGLEFGIFYYRLPGEVRGRIFSITDKRFPSVTGDGRSTLERLILEHDRAVCMAPVFLARHAPRLWEVPAAGEVIPLVELGTHVRGAVFYDGTALRTPELEGAVDTLSRSYDGFWFGRYDVRAESVAALQAGRFRVIELNGVTSEATSIYDPSNSLVSAWRTLGEQWRAAFEIGTRNRTAGARPATLRELVMLLRRHREAMEAHVGS